MADMTESDMATMGIKLGDRRKLKRAFQPKIPSTAPPTTSVELQLPGQTKRRYRRHPRADQNAPVKPKTAYVVFSEHVRTDPTVQELTFVDIAKEIGMRWQSLSPSEKWNLWEHSAATKLQQYKSDIKEYERTQAYRDHHAYLVKFYKSHTQAESSALATTGNLTTIQHEETNRATSPADEEEHPIQNQSSETGTFEPDISQDPNRSLVSGGMDEVGRIYSSSGASSRYSRLQPYAPEKYTAAAVQAFLDNTGSLLYLWSQEEVKGLLESVYHSQPGPTQRDAVELFAVSATGSYCDGTTELATYQQSFMDSFIYLLHSQVDIEELRAMRLFACLAICRFTNSVQSARKLMRR
jgi:hypothetical protein